MELDHHLPHVELNKDDIERLWQELLSQFDPPPPGLELKSVSTSISADSRNETVKETDIDRFFGSGLLGDLLESLTIVQEAEYAKPEERVGRYKDSRRVHLYISNFGSVSVTLNGDREWILRVRAALDSYFETRKRHVRGLRFATAAILALFPTAAIFSIGARLDDVAVAASSASVGVFGTLGLYGYLEKWYPTNLIILDERGLRRPWYVNWAREVVAGVVIASIATILISLFFGR